MKSGNHQKKNVENDNESDGMQKSADMRRADTANGENSDGDLDASSTTVEPANWSIDGFNLTGQTGSQ
jgi:hypothetical protein